MNVIKRIIKHIFFRSLDNKIYQQCAFHESGHIVMAYLSRFKCDSVTILEDGSGDAFTKFDYGKSPMTELIASLVNFSEYPQMFYSLPLNVRAAAPQVALKICGTLLGGPVSEALYKVGVDFEGDLPIEVAGPDLQRVTSIDHLLRTIDPNHKPNYINEALGSVVQLIRNKQTWEAIEALSKEILNSKTKSLSRVEIENSLENSGYLDFIK
jgi:hypothetical protein